MVCATCHTSRGAPAKALHAMSSASSCTAVRTITRAVLMRTFQGDQLFPRSSLPWLEGCSGWSAVMLGPLLDGFACSSTLKGHSCCAWQLLARLHTIQRMHGVGYMCWILFGNVQNITAQQIAPMVGMGEPVHVTHCARKPR